MIVLTPDYLASIRRLCDALEWLLVPWGHKHTGRVTRSTLDRPAMGPVWTNKSTTGGLLADGPEASMWLDVTRRTGVAAALAGPYEVVHTTGGSPEWVLDPRGAMAVRLCREIATAGWAVQFVDAEHGVTVTAIPSTEADDAR